MIALKPPAPEDRRKLFFSIISGNLYSCQHNYRRTLPRSDTAGGNRFRNIPSVKRAPPGRGKQKQNPPHAPVLFPLGLPSKAERRRQINCRRLRLSKNPLSKGNHIQNHKNQDMRLIFIPRPAPTGARNRGYRRWFLQEPAAYPGGMGYPLEACRTFSTRSSLPVSLGRGDFKLWRNPVGENRKKTKRRPAPGMIAPGPAPGEGGERRRLVRTISCFSPINLRREAAPGGGG